jgi:hypothetical protein
MILRSPCCLVPNVWALLPKPSQLQYSAPSMFSLPDTYTPPSPPTQSLLPGSYCWSPMPKVHCLVPAARPHCLVPALWTPLPVPHCLVPAGWSAPSRPPLPDAQAWFILLCVQVPDPLRAVPEREAES